MSLLTQFSLKGGAPLLTTRLTGTGTFTPLSTTTWFYLTLIGAGGAGGSSSYGYYSSGGGNYHYWGSGGQGGTCGQIITQWYSRDSAVSSYGYIAATASAGSTTWNTGTVGTQGQLIALGGNTGSGGQYSYQGNYNTASHAGAKDGTPGESCIFGVGGIPGSPGSAGLGYGAGGGGGTISPPTSTDTYTYKSGGAGAPGLIIVVEY